MPARAHRAFSDREYAFRLFRLARLSDETIVAKPFDRDAVEAATRADLELR